jgi:hypothetical protein
MADMTFGALFMAILLEGFGALGEPLVAYATLVFLLPFLVAGDVAIRRHPPRWVRWLDKFDKLDEGPLPRATARYRS